MACWRVTRRASSRVSNLGLGLRTEAARKKRVPNGQGEGHGDSPVMAPGGRDPARGGPILARLTPIAQSGVLDVERLRSMTRKEFIAGGTVIK